MPELARRCCGTEATAEHVRGCVLRVEEAGTLETVIAESAEARRARAAADPTRWRVGGSPADGDSAHCTIYQGTRFVGSVRVAADAEFLVACANEWQRLAASAVQAKPGQWVELAQEENPGRTILHNGRLYPAGEQLDAERRGEHGIDPESGEVR
jgi:hypothetical protein